MALTISKKLYISLVFSAILPLVILSALLIPAIGRDLTPKLAFSVAMILISTILTSLLIAKFLSLHITEPIDKLVNAVRKMEQGEFEPVEINTGDDLEVLGRAFNSMGREVSRVIKELKELDEAKTQFLSITSHELRTPLTPIKSQLQLLLKGYLGKLNDKQIKSLQMIERNTDRLNRLLQELLEISRIQSGRLKLSPSKENLSEIIKNTLDFLKPYIEEKGLTLRSNLEDVEIEFDKDKITQVIQNLITNAIKFTDSGEIEVNLKRYGDGAMVSVKDTGVGMSEEEQKNVFKPFFQADSWRSRKTGGVGLGLAISKGIIEAHGGKMWCESKPNKGSTFYFVLPPKPGEEIKLTHEEEVRERVKTFFEEST